MPHALNERGVWSFYTWHWSNKFVMCHFLRGGGGYLHPTPTRHSCPLLQTMLGKFFLLIRNQKQYRNQRNYNAEPKFKKCYKSERLKLSNGLEIQSRITGKFPREGSMKLFKMMPKAKIKDKINCGDSFYSWQLEQLAPIQQDGRKSRKLYAVPNKQTNPHISTQD